jgi:Mg/Co/Ni transporter MgtE
VPALLFFADGVTQQSAGMKVRRLRRGLPALQSLRRQLRGEFVCGLCLGLGGGLILAGVAQLWSGSWRFAVCVAIVTAVASGLSAAFGLLIPWYLREIPARPWMAAGPPARLLSALSALVLLFGLTRLLV